MLATLLALCAFGVQDVKPAPEALMTVDNRSFTVYDVSGGDPYADIVSQVIGGAAPKHVNSINYSPVHLRLDREGFAGLRSWITGTLASGSKTQDGTISFNGRELSFKGALITLVTFPSFAPGDSGMIDLEFIAEQYRYGVSRQGAVSGKRTPFTSATMQIVGLGNPSIDSVTSKPTFAAVIAADQIGSFRESTKHPAKVTVSDLTVEQTRSQPGGISDWVKPWFIDGHHSEQDEKTSRITYFVAGKAEFAIEFGHCGLKNVTDILNPTDKILATLYAASMTIAAPATGESASKSNANSNDALPPTEDGTFGKFYLDSSDKNVAVNVTGASYVGERYATGITAQTSNIWLLNSNEKFFVLTVNVKNLGTEEFQVGYDHVLFNIEDDTAIKVDGIKSAFRLSDRLDYHAPLAGGKSVDLQYLVAMSSLSKASKLRVWVEDPAISTAYDLAKNKVDPLPTALTDASGSKMFETVDASIGAWFPTGYFDVQVERIGTTTGPIMATPPDEGKIYTTISCKIRNASRGEAALNYDTFHFVGYTKDGQEFTGADPVDKAMKSSVHRTFQPSGTDGSESQVVYYFQFPKEKNLAYVTFREATGHLFKIKLN